MATLRFPKAFRIRRKSEYDRVFREGRKRSSPALTVVCAPNGLKHQRLGIMASKALGGAVQRNRVKRLFREAFRLRRAELPEAFDVVAIPRPLQKGWTLAAASEQLLRLTAEAARAGAKSGRQGPAGPRGKEAPA